MITRTQSTSSIRENNVISNRKESYFVQNTPSYVSKPNHIGLDASGSIMYTLQYNIDFRIVEQPEMPPEIVTDIVSKTIGKYHIMSGKCKKYELDSEIMVDELRSVLEMYVLTDNLIVLIGYEHNKYQFSQYVIHLDDNTNYADIVLIRRFTITRIVGSPLINLSMIDKGRIIISGGRQSTEDGKVCRMTLNIASDPMKSHMKKDEDLSDLMELFNKYLMDLPPENDGQQMMSLFVLSIDDNNMRILLTENTNKNIESTVFTTKMIGNIDRKTCKFSVVKVDNCVLGDVDQLKVGSLSELKVRNGNVWMSFAVIDHDKLKTLKWRLKTIYVRIMLRLMVAGLHVVLYLSRFDNGFSMKCLAKVLVFLHGPTMMPLFNPGKKLHLCYLDLNGLKYHRMNHIGRQMVNPLEPYDSYFAIGYDIDRDGGAAVIDLPTEKDPNMIMNYYPNPSKPQSLARMAMYSAYRNYPSFEKSSLIRKMTGCIDWKWSI